ncbi:hypothetical protein [Streptomyces abyssomicinicus]|uniref:hypothetical protein n=1 Tax=Streptomyces abyssomicinicus TaxID=574929 RepID=UPI0015836E81|nr:hypothetical protein [Streptomyces abyssomicinicus]
MTRFPSSGPVAPDSDEGRLVTVGRALFARLTDDPVLRAVELPDGLGVCLVHTVRGGGKLYVAHDETALFVSSAVDFQVGLAAFRDGARTPPEKFGADRQAADDHSPATVAVTTAASGGLVGRVSTPATRRPLGVHPPRPAAGPGPGPGQP